MRENLMKRGEKSVCFTCCAVFVTGVISTPSFFTIWLLSDMKCRNTQQALRGKPFWCHFHCLCCIQSRDCPLSWGLVVASLVQIQARFRLLATTPSVAASSLDSVWTLPLPLHFIPLTVSPDHNLIEENCLVLFHTWPEVIATLSSHT